MGKGLCTTNTTSWSLIMSKKYHVSKKEKDLIEELKHDPVAYEYWLNDLYTSVHEHLTPDFTAEDWMSLHSKAYQGDITSIEMLASLWERKVFPHIPDEFKTNYFKGI